MPSTTLSSTGVVFPDATTQTTALRKDAENTYTELQTFSDGISVTGTVDASGNISTSAGVVSDSKGDVRKVVGNQKSAAYTAVLADSGKSIVTNANVTIPNNVFSQGDVVTIVSYSGANLTITMQPTTSFISGTATGKTSVTLKPVGVATVFFVSPTYAIISGNVV